MENITIRKKMQRSKSELNLSLLITQKDDDYNVLNSTFLDSTVLSLHSATQNNTSFAEELKTEIQVLKEKLRSADAEIEELNCENRRLKEVTESQTKKIELLKKLSTENTPINRIVSTPIRKRMLNIKMKTSRFSPLHFDRSVCASYQRTSNSSKEDISRLNSDTHTDTNISNKQTDTEISTVNQSLFLKTSNKHEVISNHLRISGKQNKKQVIILADQQGKNLREQLQKLLGDEYHVTCYLKPGARLNDVANCINTEVKTLTKNDFVILLCGTNDTNPYDIRSNLNMWLNTVSNTNIIVSEVPFNSQLHENKLNYTLQLISKKYNHVTYMNMDYSRRTIPRKFFPINLARSILKDILHIVYKNKMEQYKLTKLTNHKCIDYNNKVMTNKYTQTDPKWNNNAHENFDTNNINTTNEATTPIFNNNCLFRL